MKKYKLFAVAWIIGYFVIFFPLYYSQNVGSLMDGLLHSIFGVAMAILILNFGDKWEDRIWN